LVIGHWSLVIGHWSLVIGHWSLVIGHWSLVIGHWSFRAYGAACAICDQKIRLRLSDLRLLTTRYSLLPRRHQPPLRSTAGALREATPQESPYWAIHWWLVTFHSGGAGTDANVRAKTPQLQLVDLKARKSPEHNAQTSPYGIRASKPPCRMDLHPLHPESAALPAQDESPIPPSSSHPSSTPVAPPNEAKCH